MNMDGEGWRFFPQLKRRIMEETGLDCNQYKDKYLKRRIAVRMRARNVKDCGAYSRILRSDAEEQGELLRDLTINVTSFFRDPEMFEVLEKGVLPSIVGMKEDQNRKVIRIWSAGCASGEETYSIAMLMLDLLGDDISNFIVSVLGTDIDKRSLAKAKDGTYQMSRLEDVRPEYLDRFFIPDNDGYCVNKEVRSLVRFKRMDLFSDIRERYFDLILCRNVVIYFSKETQIELFVDFYDSLTNDGYLVLGKTEMLLGEARDMFDIVNSSERIYKKRIVVK